MLGLFDVLIEMNEIVVDHLAAALSLLARRPVLLAACVLASASIALGQGTSARGGRQTIGTDVGQFNYKCTAANCANRSASSKFGDVVAVADFTGADFCAQLKNAMNSLPSGGGIVDARMITGTVSCASNPFLGLAVPTAIYFGDTTINISVPWVIAYSPVQLIGNGTTSTMLQYTGASSPYFIKIGTPTPATVFVQEFRLQNMLIRGNANTADVLYVTGTHRSYFAELELMDATGCGLHTAFAVVNTFRSVHVTGLGTNGPFLVQPARGMCFDQIDAAHQTTASTITDPIVEGVSGSGIWLWGAVNMVFTGGTSEWNNRGIEIPAGSSSTQNAFIGMDLEQNTTEDILVGAANNSFYAMLSGSLTHVANQGNVFSGGFYKNVTIDAGSLGNSFDISYNNGAFTDNGMETKVRRLLNTGTAQLQQVPWASRETNPAVPYTNIGTPDKQDTLTGNYSIVGITQTQLSNTVYTGSSWRVMFVGTWANNIEGGGLAQPAPFIEVTSAAPTVSIGTPVVTVSMDGSGHLQMTTGNAAHRVGFTGRIYVMANLLGTAGTASMRLKGSVEATALDVPTVANLNIGTVNASSVNIGRAGWAASVNSSIAFLHRQTVADTIYTATGADYTVAYTSITATRVVTLPAASGSPGLILIIKDESGSASGTVKIQATAAGSDKLDGVTAGTPKDLVITAYGAARLYSSGANWFTF
jgi:hypothetical protein